MQELPLLTPSTCGRHETALSEGKLLSLILETYFSHSKNLFSVFFLTIFITQPRNLSIRLFSPISIYGFTGLNADGGIAVWVCFLCRMHHCNTIFSGGDIGKTGNADRHDSDGDDSDGPDDEDNDGEEEDEEDSQAESGLSATPSVSASPQHLPSSQADPAPSSLLAQMSISPNPNPTHISGSKSQAIDSDSVALISSGSLVRQRPGLAACYSHGPDPLSPAPQSSVSYPAPSLESNSSDTESVHMLSPVSPCRQMSIDYPDLDLPPSPPMPIKSSSSGQVRSVSFPFHLPLSL